MPGFTAEVSGILERMKTEPQKAAAMFRNRITTMQHSELWRDCLTGIMTGETRRYPASAYRIVEEYFTRKVVETEDRRQESAGREVAKQTMRARRSRRPDKCVEGAESLVG
jgi:hypothetical protein